MTTSRPWAALAAAPAVLMLIWLAFAAGRGCGTDAPPKRPAPEVKAQRAAEEDVAALRERLAAEDVADAAAWQAQIDLAVTTTEDGDTDTQLQQLAALARQAKQRNKR